MEGNSNVQPPGPWDPGYTQNFKKIFARTIPEVRVAPGEIFPLEEEEIYLKNTPALIQDLNARQSQRLTSYIGENKRRTEGDEVFSVLGNDGYYYPEDSGGRVIKPVKKGEDFTQIQLGKQELETYIPPIVRMLMTSSQQFGFTGAGQINKSSLPLYVGRYFDKRTGRTRTLNKPSTKYVNPYSFKSMNDMYEARIMYKWNSFVRAVQNYYKLQIKGKQRYEESKVITYQNTLSNFEKNTKNKFYDSMEELSNQKIKENRSVVFDRKIRDLALSTKRKDYTVARYNATMALLRNHWNIYKPQKQQMLSVGMADLQDMATKKDKYILQQKLKSQIPENLFLIGESKTGEEILSQVKGDETLYRMLGVKDSGAKARSKYVAYAESNPNDPIVSMFKKTTQRFPKINEMEEEAPAQIKTRYSYQGVGKLGERGVIDYAASVIAMNPATLNETMIRLRSAIYNLFKDPKNITEEEEAIIYQVSAEFGYTPEQIKDLIERTNKAPEQMRQYIEQKVEGTEENNAIKELQEIYNIIRTVPVPQNVSA